MSLLTSTAGGIHRLEEIGEPLLSGPSKRPAWQAMPNTSMMPMAGTVPTVLSVAAKAMNPPPATPAAPLDVSSMTASRRSVG